jgi:predicted double-glycine peptidase
MKLIFEKWWTDKVFSIRGHRKDWKENGNKPRVAFWTNGAKKGKDKCLDAYLVIGYTVFNYTDFNYDRRQPNE